MYTLPSRDIQGGSDTLKSFLYLLYILYFYVYFTFILYYIIYILFYVYSQPH